MDATTNSCGGKMPSAAELRKSNKPLMEKKRRARINHCLAQLKSLVVDAMRKENKNCSKLEKADILELTVKHLRGIQRQRLNGPTARRDTDVLSKYVAGFNECAAQVSRFMSMENGHDLKVRTNLLNHLAGCLQKVSDSSTPPPPVSVKQEPRVSPPPTGQVFCHPAAPSMGQAMYHQNPAAAAAPGGIAMSSMIGLPHHFANQTTKSPPLLVGPSGVIFGTNGAFRPTHTTPVSPVTESSALYNTPIHAHQRLVSSSVSSTSATSTSVSPSNPWSSTPTNQLKQERFDNAMPAAEAPVLPPRGHSPHHNGQQQIQPRKLDMENESMWRPW